jgi:hypothetical protein
MRTLSPWAISGIASIWGGVGVEIPVSWSSPFSGGERRAKASCVVDATKELIGLEKPKINFLGGQKYPTSVPHFFSVIFFRNSL